MQGDGAMREDSGSTLHTVDRVFTRAQALAAFDRARREDVMAGGVYDARAAAIQVWSLPWDTPEHQVASSLVGSLYIRWGAPDDDHVVLWGIRTEASREVGEMESHASALFAPALRLVPNPC
jgi:hypothetical protein